MNDINIHNLDEWLFEYFEGNLNDHDTERLLEAVGKNNQYMEEFNVWKKSYLTDYPSVQYAASDKLKKKPSRILYWISAPLFFALGVFFFNSNKELSSDKTTPVLIKKEASKIYPIEATKQSSKVMSTQNVAQRQKNNSIKTSSSDHSVYSSPSIFKEATSTLDSNQSFEESINESKESVVDLKTNEVNNINPVKETSAESVLKTKTNKRSKKIRLKPSEEINKMNSDF